LDCRPFVVERGKETDRKEAIPETRREDVLRIVEERCDQVPPTMPDMVLEVTDEENFDAMLSAAARAQTVEQLGRMVREARESAREHLRTLLCVQSNLILP
jgi:hypothetical protein